MKRWVRWWPHLKWLRPGMGVKRWALVLFVGLALMVFAASIWLETLSPTIAAHLIRPGISPLLEAIVLLGAGSALVFWSVYRMNRTVVSAFERTEQHEVVDVVYRHRQRQRGPKIVAIGGGHGLNTLLRGIKEHTDNITAIVTVADDGGSSGRLRRDLGMLPPGDFRNCLAALSDAEGLVSQLFQYRFGAGTDLDGHSFGNLYLTAMTAITGSFEGALAESSRVLAVRGRVIPSTLAQITLCAEIQDAGSGRIGEVRGESAIGQARGRIQRVYLEPDTPPAYPEAIRAILEAELIVIGPGSLYTSVLPNLLVPDLAQALASAAAPKVYVCNVATQAGETEGYDVADHVNALRQHVGRGLIALVLSNATFASQKPPGQGVDWVRPGKARSTDYRLTMRDLVDGQYPWRHDPGKLAEALMELIRT